MRRIGVLMTFPADDTEGQARVGALLQGLQQLAGPLAATCGSKSAGPEAIRTISADTLPNWSRLRPTSSLPPARRAVGPLLQATRTVPIVFAIVPDPVGAGFVDSLARPGGNATGFMLFEYGMGGKWLELLRELAPGVTRVGVLRDPTVTTGIGQFGAIQTAAPSFGVELSPIDVRDAAEIERAVTAFARAPNGGLIVTGSALAVVHRDLIDLACGPAQLPAVYLGRHFVAAGGLISYGPDFLDQYRRAAGYVDRILKGEKPADLPVQAPTKYELVINLKTAKALGLEVPPTLLARADEVIE